MAKKKISSKDFLNLLDVQEATNEKPVFKPRKSAPKASLSPLQKELVDFALSKSPRFVSKWAASVVGRMRKT